MPRHINIFIHAAFWIFTMGTTFYFWELEWYYKKPHAKFFTGIAISWIARLGFFYANYLFLVPKFLLKRRYSKYLLFLLVIVAGKILAISFVWNDFSFYNLPIWKALKISLITDIILYFSVSTGLRIIENWLESKNRKEALQEEVKKTELLYLKSQMSPHFLFNISRHPNISLT